MNIDFFNQELAVDDYVLGSYGVGLELFRVIKLTPKMVRIVSLTAKTRISLKGTLRYSKELYKLEPHMATFYIMNTK